MLLLIYLIEDIVEGLQELQVLVELEVKDALDKVSKQQFIFDVFGLFHFISAHLAFLLQLIHLIS